MTPVARSIATIFLVAVCPLMAGAQAPCVAPAFDQPLPAAEHVVTRYADVPAARFPGRWQEGQIHDYIYRLYPDLSGSVGDPPRMNDWRVEITCDAQARTCVTEASEEAPELAIKVAEVLGQCLLGADITAEVLESLWTAPEIVPEPLPLPLAVIDPAPEPVQDEAATLQEEEAERGAAVPPSILLAEQTDQAPVDRTLDNEARPSQPLIPSEDEATNEPAENVNAPPSSDGDWDPNPSTEARAASPLLGPSLQPPQTCGLQTLAEGSPVLTLQRLLWIADQDPGPRDGIMGRRTLAALVAYLGPEAADLSVEEAIRQVDLELCYK